MQSMQASFQWGSVCHEAADAWETLAEEAQREAAKEIAAIKDTRKEDWKDKLAEGWKAGGSLNFFLLKKNSQKNLRFLETQE